MWQTEPTPALQAFLLVDQLRRKIDRQHKFASSPAVESRSMTAVAPEESPAPPFTSMRTLAAKSGAAHLKHRSTSRARSALRRTGP